MIDQQDRVYQANLGEESAAKAQEITRLPPTLTPAGKWQNLKKRPVALTQPGVFIHLATGEGIREGSPAKAGFVLDNAASSALMLPEFAAHTPSLVFVTC